MEFLLKGFVKEFEAKHGHIIAHRNAHSSGASATRCVDADEGLDDSLKQCNTVQQDAYPKNEIKQNTSKCSKTSAGLLANVQPMKTAVVGEPRVLERHLNENENLLSKKQMKKIRQKQKRLERQSKSNDEAAATIECGTADFGKNLQTIPKKIERLQAEKNKCTSKDSQTNVGLSSNVCVIKRENKDVANLEKLADKTHLSKNQKKKLRSRRKQIEQLQKDEESSRPTENQKSVQADNMKGPVMLPPTEADENSENMFRVKNKSCNNLNHNWNAESNSNENPLHSKSKLKPNIYKIEQREKNATVIATVPLRPAPINADSKVPRKNALFKPIISKKSLQLQTEDFRGYDGRLPILKVGQHFDMRSTKTNDPQLLEDIKAKCLANKNPGYFSYTPSEQLRALLVLKKPRTLFECSESQVKTALLKLEVPVMRVENFRAMWKPKRAYNRYLVEVERSVNLQELFKKTTLLEHANWKWSKLKKPSITQCRNCQRYGHVASNCRMPFRCIKCRDPHAAGQCPRHLSKDSLIDVYCHNCQKTGHPSNYRGCAAYKERCAGLKRQRDYSHIYAVIKRIVNSMNKALVEEYPREDSFLHF